MKTGITIRRYKPSDYGPVAKLYKQKDLYGGEFSAHRDARKVLEKITKRDPYAIIVAEDDGNIVGTVSLIENERIAWLYRFCVLNQNKSNQIAKGLFKAAERILKRRGHKQVLVYTSPTSRLLRQRYLKLGFNRGSDYSCFWKDIRVKRGR